MDTMIGVIGGDSSQIVDDFVAQASALQTLAYTRHFEADADAPVIHRGGNGPGRAGLVARKIG